MELPKWQKWSIGLLVSGLLLLLLSQLLIDLLLVPVVERGVREYVHRTSDGLYRITNLDANWNMARRTLRIDSLVLEPDSTYLAQKRAEGQEPRSWVSIKVPKIEIERIYFREVFLSNHIFLGAARVYRPEIHLTTRLSANEVEADSLARGTLLPLIQDYFDAVYIQEIMVSNGQIRYNDPERFRQHAFEMQDLSLAVSDFRLDSAHTIAIQQPFYAKKLELEVDINQYTYILPDSTYQIKVGKLGFSSQQSKVYAEDLELRPNYRQYQDQIEAGQEPDHPFEVKLKRIQLADLDLPKALFQNELEAGSFRIIEPEVVQLVPLQSAAPTDGKPLANFTQADLFQRIRPFFERINFEGLTIEKGKFRRIQQLGDSTAQFSLRGIGVYLQQFRIDSTLLRTSKGLRLAKEIEFKADAYRFALAQGKYRLLGRDVRFSSQTDRFQAGALELQPRQKMDEKSLQEGLNIVAVRLPGVQIEGLDLQEAWYERVMDVNSIRIDRPDIDLYNVPDIQQQKVDSLNQANLYSLISPYLDTLRVRDLQIGNGNFKFNPNLAQSNNRFQAPDFSVAMQNFMLSPGQKQNPFYADDIAVDLNIDQYQLLLPDSSYALTIGRLGISTADSSIYADSIRLIPQEKILRVDETRNQNQAEVFIPRLYLNGLNAYQAYFNRVLEVDSIGISHPAIQLNSQIRFPRKVDLMALDSINLYPWIEPYLRSVKARIITLDSARFERTRIQGDSIEELRFTNIHLEARDLWLDSTTRIGPDNLFYTQDISLTVHDWVHPLPDSVHILSVDQLKLSTQEGKIQAREIDIQPRDSLTARGDDYQMRIPSFEITGFDAYELYEDKVLDVERIRVRQPRLNMTRLPNVEKEQIDSLAQADLYDLISSQLNALRVRSFVIMDGEYGYRDQLEPEAQHLEADNILVLISNFQIDEAARAKTDNPFYADNIEVSIKIKPYSLFSPDSAYRIEFDEIGVSTEDSSILVENVMLIPQKDHPRIQKAPNTFELFIPRIRFTGINANELYFERKLSLPELSVESPRIRWEVKHTEALGEAEGWNLQQALLPYFDQVEIGALDIKNGKLHQIRPPGDSIQALNVSRFSAHASQFLLDSLDLIRPDRLFYADELDIEIGEFSRAILDSLYTVRWKAASYRSGDQFLLLDSLEMVPNFEIIDFVIDHGYRLPQMHIQTHQVEIDNVNLYQWLELDRIHLPKVYMGGLDFNIEEDKRFRREPVRKLTPPELLRSIDPYFRIDSLFITGGELRYRDKLDTQGKKGFFFMDDIHATISNLTNGPEFFARNASCQMQVETRLMGDGLLNTTVEYFLADSLHGYLMSGTLGEMDLDKLNPYLEPGANVRVNRGKAQKMEFRYRGNDRITRGRMLFWYDDLHVSVIDKKRNELEPTLIRKFWASFFANTIVRSRNPKARFMRIGQIEWETDPERGFVSHWVQSILSGVKSSVGLANKEERDNKMGWKDLEKAFNP